jgi:hypothetical protein
MMKLQYAWYSLVLLCSALLAVAAGLQMRRLVVQQP